jgi:crotonobetainyl-CoA:carnitine CoA-transferase CaiB-like acyl-CoA transferase
VEKPDGREILKGLISQADVLKESFRQGVMDDWGIGCKQIKEINLKLIFVSITDYG